MRSHVKLSQQDFEAFFIEADTNKDGLLTFEELVSILRRYHYQGSDSEVMELFNDTNASGSGKITHVEFMTAMGFKVRGKTNSTTKHDVKSKPAENVKSPSPEKVNSPSPEKVKNQSPEVTSPKQEEKIQRPIKEEKVSSAKPTQEEVIQPQKAKKTSSSRRSHGEDPRKVALRRVFQYIDKDGNGTIDKKELQNALSSLGKYFTEREIQNMVKRADSNPTDSINYEEFMDMVFGADVRKK